MNTIEKIIVGLNIANLHNGYISAEHDEMYISMDTEPTDDEKKQLDDAGWRVEKHTDSTCWRHNV